MTKHLESLLEAAKKVVLTEQEKEEPEAELCLREYTNRESTHYSGNG
jgi:hypothetical protein